MDHSLKNTQKLFVDFLYQNKGFDELRANIISPSPYEVLQIYRKHVWKSLRHTLESHYKVLSEFLGEDKFYKLANLYIANNPSQMPDLELYGWNFPEFLLEQMPRSYLAYDIAKLGLATVRAGLGPSYTCAPIEKFTSIKPTNYENIVFHINPTYTVTDLSYDIFYQFLNTKNFDNCEHKKNSVAVVRNPYNILNYVKLSEIEHHFIDLCIKKRKLLEIFTIIPDDLDMQSLIPRLVQNQIIQGLEIKKNS